jgi:hypothetical protein
VIDPRTVPVRYSSLRALARSPLHYFDACQQGRTDSLAMRLGRGAHALLLDQPVAVFTGKVRNGKVWDAFESEHTAAGDEILNQREYDVGAAIRDAVMRDEEAAALLRGTGVQLEQQLSWSLDGRACSSRPDAFSPYHVTELKTTRDASPGKFIRDAQWRGYHGQLAFYRAALRSLSLSTVGAAYIIAVESVRPYAVTVFEVTPRALELGTRLYSALFERLRVCEESNEWPAYVQSVQPLDVEEELALSGFDDDEGSEVR